MKVCINPQYAELSEFVNNLHQTFSEKGKLLFDSRNTIKIFEENGYKINVKSFKKPILLNQFVYRYIRQSKAQRSFDYAKKLLDKGINTPAPIAYIEVHEHGLLTNSYYVSIHEKTDGTMRELYGRNPNENKKLEQSFAAFTAELHDKRIFHKDYSPGNILYKKQGDAFQFYLVDLNRMKFKDPNIFEACKSFRRLRANKQMLDTLASTYSKIRKYDKNMCNKLIHVYNKYFWKKYIERHPEFETQK